MTANDEWEFGSGPFCRHWGDPVDCEEVCVCGHECRWHNGDCYKCDCQEFIDPKGVDDRESDLTGCGPRRPPMTTDPTEATRRQMIATGQPEANLAATPVEERMTTSEMQEKYTVTGFMAPFVGVVRKSDGAAGTLEFTHDPRLYFNFRAE